MPCLELLCNTVIILNGNIVKLTSGTPGGAGMEAIAKTSGYCDARRFGVSHSKMNPIFYWIVKYGIICTRLLL